MTPSEVSALFPEGTAVCLSLGGPLMTVEATRRDGVVATVWFDGGTCHHGAFHPDALTIWKQVWPE